MIPLFAPYIAGREADYVQQCLDARWLAAGGEFNRRFAEAMAGYLGTRHALPCNSGTSALHLVLQVIGVRAGDTVLVSDLTFVATANPIRYLGAEPVLIDAHPEHWNVDVELMARELRRRADEGRPPRAVLPAHILGRACRLDLLMATAQRYEVPVIEDAAEALAATVDGRQAGSFGRAGCFSFNGNKLITTAGGGLIATDDDELARQADHLLNQAKLPGPGYMHDAVGYNYRLSNVAAAIGMAQFEQLPTILTDKHRIAQRYRCLEEIPGITLPHDEPGTASSDWLTTILIDETEFGRSRDEVMTQLRARDVETRPIWSPLHKMPMYARSEVVGRGVADRLDEQGLSLPSFAGLADAQQTHVVESVRALYRSKK
ncbi:MAG: aminotransferase class I/II-fold pyridoxal phosphate-dependent enzyme [Phycisphaerae bacterium]|nr:aminotransferase class I/II-fold pyridoxal phosphate-dependent enzyme [Phycisphaerae bacterium]